GGEAHEHRRLHPGLVEDAGARVLGGRLVADLPVGLEVAVRAGAAGMHHALGDPLAVEMGDLLDELVVLERRGTPLAHRAGALVVADRVALAGRQDRALIAHAKDLSVVATRSEGRRQRPTARGAPFPGIVPGSPYAPPEIRWL